MHFYNVVLGACSTTRVHKNYHQGYKNHSMQSFTQGSAVAEQLHPVGTFSNKQHKASEYEYTRVGSI